MLLRAGQSELYIGRLDVGIAVVAAVLVLSGAAVRVPGMSVTSLIGLDPRSVSPVGVEL